MKGVIFDIQRYSIHDGPGIRTVVFLKGCPLRCIWCCNPESQNRMPESDFGYQEADAEEVLQEVLKDRAFYLQSGGGVTLSGGEALAQPEFTKELLQRCYDKNIHTTIETTGYADWEIFEEIIPYTNLILYDIKHMDDEAHKRLTGVSNKKIFSNLYKLSAREQEVILRIPFIPTYNDTPEHLRSLADLAKQTGFCRIHLMPFHQLGKEKYRRLGREYLLSDMPGLRSSRKGAEVLEKAKKYLESEGCQVWIGG